MTVGECGVSFRVRPDFTRCWKRRCGRNPDGEALVCADQRLTYRELDAEVGRVAAGLAARGVGKGDRVALLLGNRIEFVVLIFAVSRLGAIWVPLNIRDQMPGSRICSGIREHASWLRKLRCLTVSPARTRPRASEPHHHRRWRYRRFRAICRAKKRRADP